MGEAGTRNFVYWVVLALLWSSSYFAIKIGVRELSPLLLVSLRMLIGSLLLFGCLRAFSQRLPLDHKSVLIYLVCGVMGSALPFALISYGELFVGSGLSALLMGIAPVATVLLAPLAHSDEKLTWHAVAGVGAGAVGLLFLFGPSAVGGASGHFLAQVAILSAALCYAFTTLFVRKFARMQALQMASGSMIAGTIIVVSAALIFENPSALTAQIIWTPSMIAAIYLGIFPTAIATLIYFYLVPRIGAARISQVNFVIPVVGSLLGVVILHEKMSSYDLMAMGLILVAVYLVSRK